MRKCCILNTSFTFKDNSLHLLFAKGTEFLVCVSMQVHGNAENESETKKSFYLVNNVKAA